jgi:hypothetical protein
MFNNFFGIFSSFKLTMYQFHVILLFVNLPSKQFIFRFTLITFICSPKAHIKTIVGGTMLKKMKRCSERSSVGASSLALLGQLRRFNNAENEQLMGMQRSYDRPRKTIVDFEFAFKI